MNLFVKKKIDKTSEFNNMFENTGICRSMNTSIIRTTYETSIEISSSVGVP